MSNQLRGMKRQAQQQGVMEEVPQEGQPPQEPVDPKVQQQVEAYVSALSKLLHGKDTKEQVYSMLQSGPPEKSIPAAAMQINDQAEVAFKKGGGKVGLDTLAAAAQFLVGDLIEIGNAGGFFEVNPEDPEMLKMLMMDTMQPYIERGLANGTIDPIELQKKVEPLMNPEAKQHFGAMGQEGGIPSEPNEGTAMESYANDKVQQSRKGMEREMMQQQQAQPQPAPQGQGVMTNG